MHADERQNGDSVRRAYRSPSEIATAARGSLVVPINGEASKPDASPDDFSSPIKKSDPLPLPGEEYRAAARFANRLQTEQRTLHFVLKDGTFEGFAYSDLRRVRMVPSGKPGGGPVLLLRFVEAGITDVEIRGRHLKDIHYFISIGVLPWVWEYPGRDFEDENTPLITSITITSKTD
jgi:hypothetical protein